MNKVQDDLYCPMLETQKIFEFDRFDQHQSTQTTDPNTTIITLTETEYTIVQDHSHKISSSVWKYFGSLKKNDELIDPNHVYCSQCFEDRKTKKYQKSTSTGNLLKHLKKAHHICLDAPQFRVKREKDGIVVTKSEIIGGYDNVQYVDTSGNCIQVGNLSQADSENEYLVHDIHEILIAEVAKRPPIYDPSLCKKNKKQIRRDLWNEIHLALNELVPLEKLPKVWKNIRDRYHKIKKDMDRGLQQKPKYRYFHLLQFLDNVDQHHHQQQKPVYTTVTNEENFNANYIMQNFDSDDPEENVTEIDNENSDFVGNCNQDTNQKSFESDVVKFKPEVYTDEEEQCEPLTKKIKLSHDECSNDVDVSVGEFDTVPMLASELKEQSATELEEDHLIEKSLLADDNAANVTTEYTGTTSVTLTTSPPTMNSMIHSNKQADEFDIFGNFVGQVMRNMSKSKARLLQMKVLQLITEFDD